jgi:tRNA 2-thiouridine synthesizing protein D
VKLTFGIMDPPFESERSTTFFRLLAICAERGYEASVFAYEGAVHLAFDRQTPHGNAIHDTTTEAENHPLPKDWLRELM